MSVGSSELREIVGRYVRDHRDRAHAELAYFRHLETDEDVVTEAALARIPNGKRHPHQYRIPRVALEESRRRLLDNLELIKAAASFGDLFELVEQISGPIPRVGELAVYDTALRIGARFGHEPSKVYLHRGTRDGAKALLGINGRRKTLEVGELPPPLRTLTPREIEDALCIYKDGLQRSASNCRPVRSRPRRGTC
jgi:hypothetical protein